MELFLFQTPGSRDEVFRELLSVISGFAFNGICHFAPANLNLSQLHALPEPLLCAGLHGGSELLALGELGADQPKVPTRFRPAQGRQGGSAALVKIQRQGKETHICAGLWG